jgi:two-component system response regulator DegU
MPLVVADDHERERTWLRELFAKHFQEHMPLFEATNGQEAIDLVQTHKPSIACLDIEMPVLNGIKAAEKILETLPQTGIVILSNHSDEVWVRQLWKIMPDHGAFAYVLKDASDKQIVEAVGTVLSGDCWIHPRIQRILLKTNSKEGNLTDAEFEVLAFICLGLTDRAIGKRLYLTDKAIQARLKSVYIKLNVPIKGSSEDDEFNHRCRAINTAIRRGLINKAQLEEWEAKL